MESLLKTKMAARCGEHLNVDYQPASGSWITTDTCPAGHPAGIATGDLLNRCGPCKIAEERRKVTVVVRETDGLERIPNDSAPKPSPEIAAPEMQAPIAEVALPLVAAPAPAPVPVPVPESVSESAVQEQFVNMFKELDKKDSLVTENKPPLSIPIGIAAADLSSLPVIPPPQDSCQQIIKKSDFKEESIQAAEVVSMSPASISLKLPGGMLLNLLAEGDQEDAVDVDAVLATVPGYMGGPSTGGLSSHVLGDLACCPRRFYWSNIVGLKPNRSSRALKIGTLYHGCMAMRYAYGAEKTFACCDTVAAAGAPEMAGLVRKMITVQEQKYVKEEWETWCPRAIEENLIHWVSVKHDKKNVRVPVCARLDMILGLKSPHDAHPGPGPYLPGVYQLDWKTTSTLTQEVTSGYGLSFQFLVYNNVFKKGGFEEVYGPLLGTYVHLAVTGRKAVDFDCHVRQRVPYSVGQLEEFYQCELLPLVERAYALLASADRENIANYPQDHTQCWSKFKCDYFDICDGGCSDLALLYHQIPEEKRLCIANFLQPKEAVVAGMPATESAKPATKVKEKSPLAEAVRQELLSSMLQVINQAPTMNQAALLGDGKSLVQVVKSLTDNLKLGYEPSNGQTFELALAKYTFAKSGVAWKTETEKGRLTWKQIAEGVCERWFDPATVLPPESSNA